MKTIFLTLSFLAIAQLTFSQDIIYTIQGEKDGQTTHLDSILFENLENQTRFSITGLPAQSLYEINLSKQGLVFVPDLLGGEPNKLFQLVRSTPGEVDIRFTGKYLEKTMLRVFNLGGQVIFSHQLAGLYTNEIVSLRIPAAGIYILNLGDERGSVNFKIAGSSTHQSSSFHVRSHLDQTSNASDQAIALKMKSLQQMNTDFSFQPGDSIRVTAFLGGYFTYPHGTKIFDSKALTFRMLRSTSDSTGVSDRYNPLPTAAYSVMAYDTLAGSTTLLLTTDTIPILPGDILTIDLDTLGLIQRVVSIREENGETIVETETAYMDELFVNQSFKLNTALMEPKTHLKSDATPRDIIEALTDEKGFIRPIRVIYHDEYGYKRIKNAFDGGFKDEIRENIVSFYEDFSKTDLYGKAGRDVHLYIDEGYTMLHADAVFEFDFNYEGELTEDTKVKRGDLNYFEFYLDAEAGFQTKLALDMKKSLAEEDTDRIFRMKRATAKFVVPPGIPVWITFSCDVYSFYNFSADASLHANWGFESNHTLQAGGKYERATNDFTPIYNYTPHNEIYPLNIEGEVNASARVEIYPRVDVRLYGFFGPFAEIAPYMQGNYNAKLQSQITFSGHETFLGWNSNIDLGLDLRVGTSLKFLFSSRDYGPININCFNLPLWASPVNLELLTEIPSEISPGQEIELKVKVTDLLGIPVPLVAVYFEGDGVFSKQLPLTGYNGIATLTWTPGSVAGEKNFNVKIFNAEQGIIKQMSGVTIVSGGNGEPPVGGLIAWYPFNGNANDASGNGNHGTVFNATLTDDRFGKINSAYHFNGSNSYITTTFKPTNINTISIFFNPESNQVYNGGLFSTFQGGNFNGYYVGFMHGHIYIYRDGNKLDTLHFNGWNQWNHLAIVSDGTSLSYYLNGKFRKSTQGTTTHTGNLIIGETRYDSRFYKGKIDDIRLFNRALTLQEVIALYYENPNISHGHWPRDTQTQVVEVINPTTGKIWMDRNLGASRAATSSNDAHAYGDLYQWGRAADGHQKRTSGTTSTLSNSDTPGHSNFILALNSPYDWRSPQNTNLWQGVNGTNNPCPGGYRLPTEAELNAERQSWNSNDAVGAFASPLKLTLAGYRPRAGDGSLHSVGSYGDYWASTFDGANSRCLHIRSSNASMNNYNRAYGHSVRCIKD